MREEHVQIGTLQFMVNRRGYLVFSLTVAKKTAWLSHLFPFFHPTFGYNQVMEKYDKYTR